MTHFYNTYLVLLKIHTNEKCTKKIADCILSTTRPRVCRLGFIACFLKKCNQIKSSPRNIGKEQIIFSWHCDWLSCPSKNKNKMLGGVEEERKSRYRGSSNSAVIYSVSKYSIMQTVVPKNSVVDSNSEVKFLNNHVHNSRTSCVFSVLKLNYIPNEKFKYF